MRLIVVRHGETAYNLHDRLTGQTDVPLSAKGVEQAKLAGSFLSHEKLDAIISSDLQRTRDTAQYIAKYHQLPIEEDADIREIGLGEWEGYTIQEVEEKEPEIVEAWRKNPSLYAPPGGETLIAVRDRIQRALKRSYTRYPDKNVLWVAHGGVIGILICHLLDIDLNRRRQFRHANASITEFRYTPEHVTFEHLNETAFLRELETSKNADTDM